MTEGMAGWALPAGEGALWSSSSSKRAEGLSEVDLHPGKLE